MASETMRFRRGFSLVELMIVLAILVTLTAIAVPNLQRNFQRNELRDAGRLLQETLGELRQEALQSGRPIYLQLGWESNLMRVSRDSAWLQRWSSVGLVTGGPNLDQAASSGTGNSGPIPANAESPDEVNSIWTSQEIELATDVRFQYRPIERTTEQESANRPSDRGAEQTDLSAAPVVAWSKPIAILPDGSVEELQFWLELDRRWQCPVLWRGATGQLEIGSVQTVKDSLDPLESRESP
ncbi:MAG: prepilin-type N-terminal cleavage/methylation domain-containing protein [Pirellulaceae bacterium]|nr:prepilin-type N-terminal cleavage/methylation domain-containing protein [Pirellulaceae bacterium]